ncbi:helix-turn-helix domain-containing protein [Gordonia sp. L191]|uniref:TetR/AcrR family transcriptional regulator n=1 Tax=Gordonia sp. L191 TaxID=2982699 RepID=UPI0024BFC265|nr:TetR/AcrR family transcriptional regulator [Gordonia sp. L191]WHU47807.1 helix-turn-helix domain-containing protein [Gordonia sp. L191]
MALADLFTSSADIAPDADPILDAALEVFADIGIRRATINDIADRARVGRVTVYRKIGGKNEILSAVMLREAVRLFAAIRAAAEAAETFPDRVANAFIATVTAIRGNPVWNRILELEPGTVLDQLTLNGQFILAAAVEACVDVLRSPEIDLDDDELHARAEILVRITHSILLTPQVWIPLNTPEEITAFARTHLLTIAGPPR